MLHYRTAHWEYDRTDRLSKLPWHYQCVVHCIQLGHRHTYLLHHDCEARIVLFYLLGCCRCINSFNVLLFWMFGISKVKYILFLLVFITTSSCSDIIHDNNTSKETKLIKLSTNMGDITLELYADKAPETVANFLKYTKEGKLNGTIFRLRMKHLYVLLNNT